MLHGCSADAALIQALTSESNDLFLDFLNVATTNERLKETEAAAMAAFAALQDARNGIKALRNMANVSPSVEGTFAGLMLVVGGPLLQTFPCMVISMYGLAFCVEKVGVWL